MLVVLFWCFWFWYWSSLICLLFWIYCFRIWLIWFLVLWCFWWVFFWLVWWFEILWVVGCWSLVKVFWVGFFWLDWFIRFLSSCLKFFFVIIFFVFVVLFLLSIYGRDCLVLVLLLGRWGFYFNLIWRSFCWVCLFLLFWILLLVGIFLF